MNRIIEKCPVCEGDLVVTHLRCNSCDTEIRGSFTTSDFGKLSEDDLAFAAMFIRLRGNVKEMEREMGIAYNAVRNRLDQIIDRLGLASSAPRKTETVTDDEKVSRRDILDALDRGDISPEEAIRKLEGEKKEEDNQDG